MLQNARVTAFTVFELLRQPNRDGEGVKLLPHTPTQQSPTKIRVKLTVIRFQ